jgi:NADH-quinone oxidoreductase subunit N
LAVCLFSLTGLPPTAGFLGKLSLFLAAWSDGRAVFQWQIQDVTLIVTVGRILAVIMALNAAIAAWYYLRLIALMFLEPTAAAPAEPPSSRGHWSSWLAGVVCTAGTVAIFLAPQWLWDSVP